MKKKSAINLKKDRQLRQSLKAASITNLYLFKLAEYIKNHSDRKFTFSYALTGISNWDNKPEWVVIFDKPIKNNHTVGYHAETFDKLIDTIINERD